MSLKKLLILSVGFALFGCTVSPKIDPRPPYETTPYFVSELNEVDIEQKHRQLEEALKENPHANNHWWTRYMQARLWQQEDPQTSCEYYLELARDEKFILREVAAVKAATLCPLDHGDPLLSYLEKSKKKTWLNSLRSEARLYQARARGDRLAEIESYVEQSKVSVHMPEKVELMEMAVALALELGDKEQLKKLQKRLYKLAPQAKPSPKRNDWLSMAYNYRRVRDFANAKKYYRKVIKHRKSGEREIYKAMYGLRTTFKLERNTPKYLEASRNMAGYTYRLFQRNKRKRSVAHYANLYHDTALLYIRAIWTDGQTSKANQMLINLEKDLGRHKSHEKTLWLRGRIADERRNFKQSSDLYQRSLKHCRSKCSDYKEIIWNLAWSLKKQKRYREAGNHLNELVTKLQDNESAKFLFWSAKIDKELGRHLEARSKLSNVIENDPFGYYGLLAHRELEIPIERFSQSRGLASEKDQPSPEKNYGSARDQLYVDWLISVGEEKVAGNFLDSIANNYRKKKRYELARWQQLMAKYAKAGAFVQLFRQLSLLPSDLKSTLLNTNPEIIFPQPYKNVVNRSAKKFGILPELIYSIMRQESAFNRTARSPADAFGLMQLIPSVAAKTARDIKVDYQDHKDLYRPEVNIPLGSAHLKELWDKYQGQFVILAASYNASEKAIRKWVRYRFAGDPLMFIEDIPYKETQGYIKLVLRNLIFYQVLNSQTQSVPFPEWCLENIQDVNI